MFLVLTDVTDRDPLSPLQIPAYAHCPRVQPQPHSSGRGKVSWLGLVRHFTLKLLVQALSIDGQSLQAPEGRR